MTDPRFEAPRWKDGPQICVAENLPAFPTKEAMDAFHDNQCPSVSVLEKWKCEACGMWHSHGVHPGPSGASSGTTRLHKFKVPKRLKFDERDDRAEDKVIQRDMRKELDS